MRDNWNNLDPEQSRGPISFGVKILLILFALGCVAGALNFVGFFAHDAGQVVKQEFSPSALLDKYTHFKDMYASLEAKKANIESAEHGLSSFVQDYGTDHTKWPRDVRQDYSQKQNELATMKQSYNALAAEYNSDMAKFNVDFTNVGKLPQGADQPLPREVAPYVTD